MIFELELESLGDGLYKVKRKGLVVGALAIQTEQYPLIFKEMELR